MIRIVAFMAYWLGIDVVFYWLNRKAKRILAFHAILPDAMFRSGVANGVSNRLSELLTIVKECQKRYRISNDLQDARTLTLTFDDGYRNQYSIAFKELMRLGVPAYVFVAGDVVDGRVLMVDKLLHWVSEVPVQYVPGGNRLAYWSNEIWPKFMADVQHGGLSVYDELNRIYPYDRIVASLPDDYVCERLGSIAEVEMDEMRDGGWKIGWHTQTHLPLSRQTEEQLRRQMTPPEKMGNVCFCYPYGNPCEVGESAVRLAEELGYPCAVSCTNSASENSSRYFLPRMSLSPDKYMLHFELSGFKHFLKHRRLLPIVKG